MFNFLAAAYTELNDIQSSSPCFRILIGNLIGNDSGMPTSLRFLNSYGVLLCSFSFESSSSSSSFSSPVEEEESSSLARAFERVRCSAPLSLAASLSDK